MNQNNLEKELLELDEEIYWENRATHPSTAKIEKLWVRWQVVKSLIGEEVSG